MCQENLPDDQCALQHHDLVADIVRVPRKDPDTGVNELGDRARKRDLESDDACPERCNIAGGSTFEEGSFCYVSMFVQ